MKKLVIIPAYNEEGGIEKTAPQTRHWQYVKKMDSM